MDTGWIQCNFDTEKYKFRDKKCKGVWQSTAIKDKKNETRRKVIDPKQRTYKGDPKE